jgi:hypothetical protein
MDRLKREWKRTQIPEEVRLRARNMAWTKLQQPKSGRQTWQWAAAATAVVTMLVLVWSWRGQEARIEQVSAPVKSEVSSRTVAVNQTTSPIVETKPALESKSVKKRIRPLRAGAPAEEQERVVLNFTLPESGARMIWIIDSRFNLNGGIQ